MRQSIAFVDDPDGVVLPEIPLLKPRSIAGLYIILTGPRVSGLFLHWNGARDLPHTEGSCSGCECGHSVRWQGYISAAVLDLGPDSDQAGGHGFFEVTRGCMTQLKVLLRGRTSARGLALHARRKDGKPNSKVLVQPIALGHSFSLPHEMDARSFIRRLYSLPASVVREGTGPAPDRP